MLLICCLTCPLCKALLFWRCWLAPIFAPDCIATQFLQQTFSSEEISDNAEKEQFAQRTFFYTFVLECSFIYEAAQKCQDGWEQSWELKIFHWFFYYNEHTCTVCCSCVLYILCIWGGYMYLGWLHASGFSAGCLSCLYHPKTCLINEERSGSQELGTWFYSVCAQMSCSGVCHL